MGVLTPIPCVFMANTVHTVIQQLKELYSAGEKCT